MSLSTKSFRATVLTLAAISGVIAIVDVAGIIPRVLKISYPGANPEGAATGFGLNAGMYLLMAIGLIAIALRSTDSSSRRPGALSGIGVLSLLLALALLDAFDAFRKEPVLAFANNLVLLSAILGFMLGVLLIIAAIVFRKRRTVAD